MLICSKFREKRPLRAALTRHMPKPEQDVPVPGASSLFYAPHGPLAASLNVNLSKMSRWEGPLAFGGCPRYVSRTPRPGLLRIESKKIRAPVSPLVFPRPHPLGHRPRPEPPDLVLPYRFCCGFFGILRGGVVHHSRHLPSDHPGRGDRGQPYQCDSGLGGRGFRLRPGRLDLVLGRVSLPSPDSAYLAVPPLREPDREGSALLPPLRHLGDLPGPFPGPLSRHRAAGGRHERTGILALSDRQYGLRHSVGVCASHPGGRGGPTPHAVNATSLGEGPEERFADLHQK